MARTADRTGHGTTSRNAAVSVSPEDRPGLAALSNLLARTGPGRKRRCELVGKGGEQAALPEALSDVLADLVDALARGEAVAIVAVARELTTQEAADLLNVSRQYVVRLLEEGQIPFSKTGTHRRIRFDDLLAFKNVRDSKRRAALEELVRLSEDAGGYDELK